MNEQEKSLFKSYPKIAEIYQDGNGNYWLNKTTAENQTPGRVKTIKKKSKTSKKLKDDTND